jgi:hypothetical protein
MKRILTGLATATFDDEMVKAVLIVIFVDRPKNCPKFVFEAKFIWIEALTGAVISKVDLLVVVLYVKFSVGVNPVYNPLDTCAIEISLDESSERTLTVV